MNSPNKLYEELLQEHPELKNSQEDIQKIIASLQEINPEIQPDEVFKHNLKQRLKIIASYNPSKGPGYFCFFKYFVPVFTFGFAIFGFMYFSQVTIAPSQDENIDFQQDNKGIQSMSLMSEPSMMMENINEDINENITEKSIQRMGLKSQQAPMGYARMEGIPEEIIDEFKDICLDKSGLVKDLEQGERICILEETSCLESDYKKEKCLIKK